MFLWPALCLLLVIVTWAIALHLIAAEKSSRRKEAFNFASSLSQAYASQVERSIMQIDQALLSLQYFWRKDEGKISLEDQKDNGLFSPSSGIAITIVDRNGRPLTSTWPLARGSPGIADRQLFLRHAQSASLGLLISGPVEGIVSKKPMLLFSRRINASDGSFDGIIVAAAAPSFLSSLDNSAIGKDAALLELRRSDGGLIVAKGPAGVKNGDGLFQMPLRLNGKEGVASFPAQAFSDHVARIAAWTTLLQYSLVALAGISDAEESALSTAIVNQYRATAAAVSLFLLFAALAGMFYQYRRAYKSHYKSEIYNAYRLATDHANEGFYMLRPMHGKNGEIIDFLIEDCNAKGAAYYGTTRQEALGQRMSSYFKGGFAENILPTYREAMETGFMEGEFKPTRHSTLRPEWVQRRIFRSGGSLAVTVRDITERKMHESDLVRIANTDSVTLLPNRHWLIHHLPPLLNQARAENRQLALLFIDLDDFKLVNDTLGHATGDILLSLVAVRLKTAIRPDDSVVRLGGDEFVIVLNRFSSVEEVSQCTERIVGILNEPFVLKNGRTHSVHASIGISLFPRDGNDIETLLKHADIAMYAVKGSGKRKAQFFHPSLSESIMHRLAILHSMENAIDHDAFIMVFQPRVHTASGELCSMEALMRWLDPERGMIHPRTFIPIAEESDLISRLGEIALRKTCEHLAQWRSLGLALVPVSVNLSPKQLLRGKFTDRLSQYMRLYDIAPSLLELEMTESAILEEGQEVLQELTAIEHLGIRMAVDDFGTGYSSLSQLKRLNVGHLKVDQSFTAQLHSGSTDEAFYRAIISMAHAIDICVVAEGVETSEQLHILQTLSCDEAQGYLISKPIPATEVPAILAKRFLIAQDMSTQ